MELQKIAGDLAGNDVALFVISYDAIEGIHDFANKHGVTYTMLSDVGSDVIRRVGMLDEDLVAHHAQFGRTVQPHQFGVAYPGVFVLDRGGVVVQKRFQATYRERESGAGLLEEAMGIAAPVHGTTQTAASDAVVVRAELDSPTFSFYQRLRLLVELTIAPGFHVYGTPIPDGYIPLSVAVAPLEGLVVGETAWPVSHPFRVEGLDEQFQVHDGIVQGVIPLTFTMPPGSGDQQVHVTVSYQTCSATECLMPAKVSLTLSVKEVPRVA